MITQIHVQVDSAVSYSYTVTADNDAHAAQPFASSRRSPWSGPGPTDRGRARQRGRGYRLGGWPGGRRAGQLGTGGRFGVVSWDGIELAVGSG